MKQQFTLFTFTLLMMLNACEKLEGQAKVNSRFQAYSKGPGSSLVTVEPATYNATLNFRSKTTKVLLERSGTKVQFLMNTPEELKKFGAYQDFSFSPQQMGQTFGLEGDATQTSSNSSEYSKTESCVHHTREVPYQHCYPDERICRRTVEKCTQKPGTNGDQPSDFVCTNRCVEWETRVGRCETRYRTENVYGSELRRGYDKTTQDFLKVKIVTPNKNVLGTMNFNEAPRTRFHETWSSGCRL